jgi:hypothetical protein
MKHHPLTCGYVIDRFSHHSLLKHKVLQLINSSPCESVCNQSIDLDITKTDWHFSKDFDRPWVDCLKDRLLQQMLTIYTECGYGGFRLNEIWYQQYQTGSQHGWHTHTGNFTNVYYLELPADAPKTQLVIPFYQNKIIELDVTEGDIVCFPSFVIHRTVANTSRLKKTIVSFNTDLHYPDETYGQGLEEHAIF